jgi:predicted RNase H-like nuclease
MEKKNEKLNITKDTLIKDILDALNSGITKQEISEKSGIRLKDLENKLTNAGITQNEAGIYIANSDKALNKRLSDRIYNVYRIREIKSEAAGKSDLEKLFSEVREFMNAEREKAKLYKPSKEVWARIKALQKLLLNVQQDWLIDALIKRALNTLSVTDDLQKYLAEKETNL